MRDLGLVDAYAFAVSKGFTGTRDEFATLMASYGTVAQAAAASAQTAQTAAQTATTKASEASASATSASGSASTASTKASEASASASTASTAASTATTKAGEASQSATSAASSATTATTKASEASASATAAQEARTGAETAQAGAESAAQTAQAGADAVGLLREQIYNSYPNVEAEAGPIVSISDGADGIPVKSLVVGIEPVQEGSGDPSPDNVRPITGWTGAKVTRCGKNLLNLVESEMILTGWNRQFPISLKAGTYIISCQNQFGASAKGGRVWLTDENGATVIKQLAGWAFGNTAFVGTAVTVTESEAEIIKNIQFELRGDGATYNDIIVGNIQLELGSNATDYEPYQGETYDITFPSSAGTVYGGSLDATNGVLTVDRLLYVYDGTENDFRKSSTALNGFYNSVSNTTVHGWPKMLKYSGEEITSEISSMFKMTRNVDTYKQNYGYCFLDSGMNFNCDPSIFGNTIASFKAKLAELYENGTPVSVFAKLATPITYQLTPTEVKTLLGQNNIWADTGDVQEMAYRADTKLYIDGVYEEYQDDLADYADALAALG